MDFAALSRRLVLWFRQLWRGSPLARYVWGLPLSDAGLLPGPQVRGHSLETTHCHAAYGEASSDYGTSSATATTGRCRHDDRGPGYSGLVNAR